MFWKILIIPLTIIMICKFYSEGIVWWELITLVFAHLSCFSEDIVNHLENNMNTKINIIKMNGGFIQAKISFDESNESYHIWLLSRIGYSDTLLCCVYDNQSFEEQINKWYDGCKDFNPKRINFDSFEDLINNHLESK